MTIDDFIQQFAFAIEVEPGTLAADTEFKRLEVWDSLNTLTVIAMADADFGITLSGQNIEEATTIGDLWGVVSSKVAK